MCTYSDILNNIVDSIIQLGRINWLDILTLIISTGSLIFAVLVPVRIANKENKTALFEKRFDAYLEITKLIKFSESLNKTNDENYPEDLKAEDVIENFASVFNCVLSNSYSILTFEDRLLPSIEKNKNSVKTIVFLYSKALDNKKVNVEVKIENIYEELKKLLKAACTYEKYDTNAADSFVNSLDDFMKNYKDILEKPLKL